LSIPEHHVPTVLFLEKKYIHHTRGHRGRDRMVAGFTTTYEISAYYHYSCEVESRSWLGALDTTL